MSTENEETRIGASRAGFIGGGGLIQIPLAPTRPAVAGRESGEGVWSPDFDSALASGVTVDSGDT